MQHTVSQCCAVYLSHIIHWYKTDTEDKHMVINHMTKLLVQQVVRELTCCWCSICSFIVQFPAETFCIISWWLNSVTVLPSGSGGKWRSTNVLCQVDLGLQTGRWCGHRQHTHTQTHTCACIRALETLGQTPCVYLVLSEADVSQVGLHVSKVTQWHPVTQRWMWFTCVHWVNTERPSGTLTFFSRS